VAVVLELTVQFGQMLLVLALAPLLTGYVRKLKAHLLRRQGPPLVQPYRDLLRLLRKEVVLAHSASRPIWSSPPPGPLPRSCRRSLPGWCSATPRT
jgi:formate hydrogenlyase subunit 4